MDFGNVEGRVNLHGRGEGSPTDGSVYVQTAIEHIEQDRFMCEVL